MGRALLLLVSGLVVISGIIQISNNNRLEVLPEESANYFKEQQAKNVATSLVDNAVQNLFRDMEWTGTISTDEDYAGKGQLLMYGMNSSGLDTVDHSVTEWNQYKVLMISRAEYEGYTAEIEVLLQRDSFSKFSYFTDAETLPYPNDDIEIYFYDDDVITGPVHTNGTLRIAGSPTFNGDVSSPNDWVGQDGDPNSDDPDERHGDETPIFNGNTNFNMATTRDLPDQAQINELITTAHMGGLTFDSDKVLEFFVDGNGNPQVQAADIYTYACGYRNWYTCEGTTNHTNYSLSNYNGLISVEGTARVKGEIKGKYTVHATDEIEIMGDIYYDTNPLDDPDTPSPDLLGLVSEGNVIVDKDAHQDNGSSNLTIHASIMALDNAFTVENYNSGSPRGTLNILGGIIQRNRGPVGTFNSYGTASGFSKNYIYDDRLKETIPPSFPRESIFTIVYWKEKVQ